VAGAPNGDVAVSFSTDTGVSVSVSRDGGETFGPVLTALTGELPGRDGTECARSAVVGERQRVSRSPRLAWDRRGRLHVVAALRTARLALPDSLGIRGGQGQIAHTVSLDRGAHFAAATAVSSSPGVATSKEVQWAPAIAPLPDGGVAVSYLQTAPSSSYEAFIALQRGGARTFSRPVALSAAPAEQPQATELYGFGLCYGLGDYTGLAPTPDGAVATWPTTLGVMRPHLDSDIAVRAVRLVR